MARALVNKNFVIALFFAMQRLDIRRDVWEKGVYLSVQIPDENSKMTHPYFYKTVVKDMMVTRIPYTPTMEDLFATDWSCGRALDNGYVDIYQGVDPVITPDTIM